MHQVYRRMLNLSSSDIPSSNKHYMNLMALLIIPDYTGIMNVLMSNVPYWQQGDNNRSFTFFCCFDGCFATHPLSLHKAILLQSVFIV